MEELNMKNQNLQQLYGQWAMDYKAFRDSGMTQAEWCSAAGININTFRYRLHKLRKVYGREEYGGDSKPNPDENSSRDIVPVSSHENTCLRAEPTFAKVDLSAPQHTPAGVNIRLDKISVSISPDTPAELARMALEVLTNAL